MNSSKRLSDLRKEFVAQLKGKQNTEALRTAEELIKMHKTLGSEKTRMYADDLFNMAILYDETGDYESSLRLYKESFDALDALGNCIHELCHRMINMGVVHCKIKSYDLAAKFFLQTKEAMESLKCTESADYVRNQYNLGNLHMEKGDYNAALEALKIAERNNKSIGESIDINGSIGYAYEALQDYNASVRYLEMSLIAMRKLMPDDKTEIMRSVYYLAGVCDRGKLYDKSLEYYKQTIFIAKELSENGKPYFPECLNAMANVLMKMGFQEKSLEIRMEALEQIKNTIGENHMYYANSLKNIAVLYKNMKDYKKAEKLLLQSLEIKRLLLGADSQEHIKDIVTLMDVYVDWGETNKAMHLLLDTLDIISLNDNDFDELITQLAKIYMSLGDINELNKIYNNVMNGKRNFDL